VVFFGVFGVLDELETYGQLGKGRLRWSFG
jgi:hypothetical protein